MFVTRRSERENDIKSITVRIPRDEYMFLRKYADARDVSMNVVITEAVSEYWAKVKRRQALDRIQSLQAKLRRTGQTGSDSVQILREIREERSDPKRRQRS